MIQYDPNDDTMIRLNGALCIESLVDALGKLQRYGYVAIISDPIHAVQDWHEIELEIIARHERRVRRS